jgi:hypothetical protein
MPPAEIDADGKRAYPDGSAIVPYGTGCSIHRDANDVFHTVEKVLRMEWKMKADQIASQKAPQDFFTPRKNAEDWRGREGDMPKKADG